MSGRGDRHAGLSPALVESVAGLTAGLVATLTVHPLDLVKTRMQIYRSTASTAAGATAGAGAGAEAAAPSAVAVLRSLVTAPRPLAALYRGLTPNLLGNAASWASFFYFKSRIEGVLASVRGSSTGTGKASGLAPADFFVASGLAGACVQVLTNPLWVLKTRMLASDRGAQGAYPSMWVGAARLLREEGPRGFYRGLGVSLLGVSHGAVQFAVYEPLKRVYLRRKVATAAGTTTGTAGTTGTTGTTATTGMTATTGSPTLPNEATLVIATTAKLVAGAATYPYQVVRSRLQNYDAESRYGRGIVGVSAQLWREAGLRSFYRGLVPSVVRVLPATWVTFLVYENVKFYLPQWFG